MVLFRGQWQLPKSEGPFVPGCIDITTEGTREHQPQLVRLYYPTDLPADQDHCSRYVDWIPEARYMEGLAGIMGWWTWVFTLLYWILAGRPKVPAVWAAAPIRRKMPVIVLSHGLGGSRVLYTTTCVQFASQGFVVAAVEHGDRSACITYRRLPEEQWIHFQNLPLHPKEFPGLRESQIEHRVKDCVSTVHLLEQLNAGSVTSPIDLTDSLDFDSLTIMGHSFGAATALSALAQESRFTLGIILDGWMYPLNKFKETLPEAIKQPLIFINTETFHIDKNIAAMRRYVKHNPLYTMRGTTHEHQTDTTHLFGSWLDLRLKNKLTPSVATRINTNLLLRWLKEHTNHPLTFDQEFLESQSKNIVTDFILPKK